VQGHVLERRGVLVGRHDAWHAQEHAAHGAHLDGEQHGAEGEFQFGEEAAHNEKHGGVFVAVVGGGTVAIGVVVVVVAVAWHLFGDVQAQVVGLVVRCDGEEEVVVLFKVDSKGHAGSQVSVVAVVGFLCLDQHGGRRAFLHVEFLAVLPKCADVHALGAP